MLTSDRQSSRGRPGSNARNPQAVQVFLSKVGITSEDHPTQSSNRVLTHQASESNFIKTPLRISYPGQTARPTTSKNGRQRNRVMSSFGR